MKTNIKVTLLLALFISGIFAVIAMNNLFTSGDNWDALVVSDSPANDVFTLSGTLNLADSRSASYINGFRGDISGTIESQLFGLFNITAQKLKLNLNTTTATLNLCGGQNAAEIFDVTGIINSSFWGVMTLDNTSYMCSNKYIYISLSSTSLGKKEVGKNGGQTLGNVFNKQQIAISGILKTGGDLTAGIGNTGNGTFNQLGVLVPVKTIAKGNLGKNIFKLFENNLGIEKTNISLNNFNTPTLNSYGENFFLYDYIGKTKTIPIKLSYAVDYKNKGEILIIGNTGTGEIPITGKKTVIVRSGNIYINSNLYNANDTSSLLILVAKRDKATGNGGNIYINPDVTNIDAVLIADGSLISLAGINIQKIGDLNQVKNLRKQLLIYGSILTSNTIGSDIMPYGADYYKDVNYTNNIMTDNIYDLGNLRSFNLNFGGSNNTFGGCSDSTKLTPIGASKKYWAGKKDCYVTDGGITKLRKSDKLNPLIVDYNPMIQLLNPYLLMSN